MAVRKRYPSDVSEEEWALVAPYPTSPPAGAGRRQHPPREVFNGLRYLVRHGLAWRAMRDGLPPWHAVYDQARPWPRAGCLEAAAADLRAVVRLAAGRAEEPEPPAAVPDSRTPRSTPEGGGRAGHERTRGGKVHLAVDTPGRLLAPRVTAAGKNDRAAVAELAASAQEATGESVELAHVDQGCTGERAAEDAAARGIAPEVVGLPEAKRDRVLLPRRWVVERSFAWMARCRRRLARDCERLPQTLAGLHIAAFAVLMLRRTAGLALVHNSL